MTIFQKFLNLKLSLLLVILNQAYTGKIKKEYNYGNKQNPEIDKLYNHLLGRNIYFIEEEPEKSMYITVIYPSLTLRVQLKIYTDSSQLINALNSGKKIYFGFDLLINNTDIYFDDFMNYRSDIMVCIFDKMEVNCHDYIYNIEKERYEINDNGTKLNNNLVPLGFKNIELNLIQDNVMEFKNFFSVKFEKEYPPLFDNITMFNWINYVGSETGDGIIGFYGVVDDDMDINFIPYDKPLYLQRHDFIDGGGLIEDIGKNIFYKYIYYVLYLLY